MSDSTLPKHATMSELIDTCEKLLDISNTNDLVAAAKGQSSIFFAVQRLLATEAEALDWYMSKENIIELNTRRYYEGKLPNSVYVTRPNKYPATTKADCDLQVKNDSMFAEVNKASKDAKRRVEFLESVLWRVKERGNDIKTIMDWKKFVEAGI